MKRPGDEEDTETGRLRKALKAKVRHPYITGQGLDAPAQGDESDAHPPTGEADSEAGSPQTADDKDDGEQDDR